MKGKSNDVNFGNLDKVLEEIGTNIRLFGKGEVNGYRRLDVILARDENTEKALAKAECTYAKLVVQF
ncbi:phosphoribosylglycinamide formyltransferase 2 [Actinobacillus lignieresii]|nr:phosphoribosylglycinamide formyltransferase 2 [Actinobacillus lignieresii]